MTVYYNENDPFCVDWLQNLIKRGSLPYGEVDDRSIEDVNPLDLGGFTQHHFFAGIGGWPYALRLIGWPDSRPVWTGSCPCQPFSGAGKRQGEADKRHLWPAFFQLIAALRLQLFLESRLPVLLGESGSPLYDLIWGLWDMPAGLPVCQQRVLVRHTSVNDFTGWALQQRGITKTGIAV